jgi:sialidase-1
MKKINFLLFIVFIGYAFMLSCINPVQKIQVNIEKLEVPVLINKQNNPVLKIDFIRLDSLPYSIEEIEISTEGTTNLSDILSIGLCEAPNNEHVDTLVQLCELQQATATVKLKKEIFIDKDSLSLWVTVSLKDKVQLNHKINLTCTGIITSKGKLVFNAPETSPSRIGVAVRQRNQDCVHTSRIPGLATSKKGTLLAIFDARYESSRDLQGHMDIALHRSTDKGATWESMQIVLDMGEWGGLPQKFNGVSDACILVDDNSGDIYIAGLWMHGVLDAETGKWIEGLSGESTNWMHQWRKKGSQPGFGIKQTCQFLIAKSTDDGLTWSNPRNITSKTKREEWWLFAPAPGHGITLSDGTLVFPTQGRDDRGESFSNITWSKDKGKTWVTSNPAFSNTTECMAVELADGSIMLNMRDNRNRGNKDMNGRRVAVTSDLGTTWKEHATSRNALIEPTCMASIHRHRYKENQVEKNILLFVNPNDHSIRDKITLKVSFDDGMTWPEDKWILLDLYKSPGYSCITSIDEGTIGILYESSLANLVFLQIPLTEILNQ